MVGRSWCFLDCQGNTRYGTPAPDAQRPARGGPLSGGYRAGRRAARDDTPARAAPVTSCGAQ
ncbi:hypothetical protein C7S15_8696 [Burkholderia cepacia]|nr:hypothetical protein [Burkholderia cepacia]